MMKWVHVSGAPRSGTGFGPPGRPVPGPFAAFSLPTALPKYFCRCQLSEQKDRNNKKVFHGFFRASISQNLMALITTSPPLLRSREITASLPLADS